ncbi:helix-turn-helix transcriptional regulator [Paracoccus sp. DMF-8]|nr:helix-turn-helix transcriptional regulator [Paracoccus sp. DMF-8]MDF3606106.1 helix-turn-helix transcriptional regulator [Paracoccus sp. DMF-8]
MKFRIKEHRDARGWSQLHLGQLAGLSKGYVSLLENGRRDPSAEALRSIAAAFGIDVTELIEPSSDGAQKLIDHLTVFQQLSEDDQDAIARIARKMLPNEDG